MLLFGPGYINPNPITDALLSLVYQIAFQLVFNSIWFDMIHSLAPAINFTITYIFRASVQCDGIAILLYIHAILCESFTGMDECPWWLMSNHYISRLLYLGKTVFILRRGPDYRHGNVTKFSHSISCDTSKARYSLHQDPQRQMYVYFV